MFFYVVFLSPYEKIHYKDQPIISARDHTYTFGNYEYTCISKSLIHNVANSKKKDEEQIATLKCSKL